MLNLNEDVARNIMSNLQMHFVHFCSKMNLLLVILASKSLTESINKLNF